MIGRLFRMEWHERDTPAALKESYQFQRDVGVPRATARTVADTPRLVDSKRRRLWESTIATPGDGWSGTETAASTKLCHARWEVWVSRSVVRPGLSAWSAAPRRAV